MNISILPSSACGNDSNGIGGTTIASQRFAAQVQDEAIHSNMNPVERREHLIAFIDAALRVIESNEDTLSSRRVGESGDIPPQ